MISKQDLKKLLNTVPEEKKSTNNFEKEIQREMCQQQGERNKTPLTVIICNEQVEHLYATFKKSRGNTLLCPDIQYLNSVNHLSNVELIVLDGSSLSGDEEIGFLIGMFQLLHHNATILLVVEDDLINSSIKLKKKLKSEERLYLLELKDINNDIEKKMIKYSSIKELPTKKKKGISISKRVIIISIILLSLMLTAVAGVVLYPYIQRMVADDEIYDRNMNVQLDMGKNTILPIKEVYSDSTGNHIIIEELTESEAVKIHIYDDEKKSISMDEQKIACPNKECNLHHILTFRKDDDIKYYIVQIENDSSIKNIEVDNKYFK